MEFRAARIVSVLSALLAVAAASGSAGADVRIARPACDMPPAFFEELAASIDAVAAGASAGDAKPEFEVECSDVDGGLRIAISLASSDGKTVRTEREVSRASALAQVRAMARSLLVPEAPKKQDAPSPAAAAPTPTPKKAARKWEPELHFKVSSGAVSGYPDMFGPTFSVSIPNRFELEGGIGWGIGGLWMTEFFRVGFPWRVVLRKQLGWNFVVVPKVGFRHTSSSGGLFDGCWGDGSCSYSSGSVEKGLNAVLSLEPVYMFFRHFGLFVQLTAGATFILGGYYETTHDDSFNGGEVTVERRKAEGIEGDFKFAIGFVF